MAPQSPQKIPGLDKPEEETFINNDSSSIDADNMDDEFDRLLNDFLNNELKDVDDHITTSPDPSAPQTSPGLAAKPKSAGSSSGQEFKISEPPVSEDIHSYFKLPETPADIPSYSAKPADTNGIALCSEEQELFNAYGNFKTAINMICEENSLASPDFKFTAEQLLPRYKPRLAEQIKDELLFGWGIMLMQYPEQLQNLNPNAADDDLLNFAEKTTDELLQMSIISYVEVLIEMESCDIAYEARRIKAKKRRIERQIMEEHEARRQKIATYIEKIQRKKFPINAERLVVNYFKTARKDPDGAYQILVNNPATYAPIEVDKIPDRLFGLIKSKPEDGIKVNREIGNYMKKLKA